MTINKLILECSRRNFVKASKLFESELEKKVCEILDTEKEEILDLGDIDESEEAELETETEAFETDEVKTESEDEEETEVAMESDVFDSTLKDGEQLESCESDEEMLDEEGEHQEKFKTLLDEFGVNGPDELSDDKKKEFFAKLKESEEEVAVESEEEETFDFEKIAESIIFGKKR